MISPEFQYVIGGAFIGTCAVAALAFLAWAVCQAMWNRVGDVGGLYRISVAVAQAKLIPDLERENRVYGELAESRWHELDEALKILQRKDAHILHMCGIGQRVIDANNRGDLEAWKLALDDLHAAMNAQVVPCIHYDRLDAVEIDDGNCRSCVGDKCTTGAECVTLERDRTPGHGSDDADMRRVA